QTGCTPGRTADGRIFPCPSSRPQGGPSAHAPGVSAFGRARAEGAPERTLGAPAWPSGGVEPGRAGGAGPRRGDHTGGGGVHARDLKFTLALGTRKADGLIEESRDLVTRRP